MVRRGAEQRLEQAEADLGCLRVLPELLFGQPARVRGNNQHPELGGEASAQFAADQIRLDDLEELLGCLVACLPVVVVDYRYVGQFLYL